MSGKDFPKYTGFRMNYLIRQYDSEIGQQIRQGDKLTKDLGVSISYFNSSSDPYMLDLACNLIHEWLEREHPESIPVVSGLLNYHEVLDDLFSVDKKYFLAHCMIPLRKPPALELRLGACRLLT